MSGGLCYSSYAKDINANTASHAAILGSAYRSERDDFSGVLVLEPIFEADLQPEQYAYRRDRSALYAVRHVHKLINTFICLVLARPDTIRPRCKGKCCKPAEWSLG
jgi:hypothetical protein